MKAALVAGVALAACGKGGGAAGGGASGGGDDINMLPADSDIVIGMNFAQITKSPLWGSMVQPLIMKGDNAKKMQEFKDKCGFDPMTSLTSVVAGFKISADGKANGIVVLHGLDKTKSLACLDKQKAEIEKDGSKYTKNGDIVSVVDSRGDGAYLTWVNDSTTVMAMGDAPTEAALKTATAGKSGLSTSAKFTEIYSKLNKSDSIWGLANGSAPFMDKMGAMGVKPKAVYGSLNVTDGLTVDMRMKLDSADQASSMAGMIKGQADMAKQFVDKLDVSNDKDELKINVAMSAAKIEALKGQMGGMFGGM
ncbi:MAG TPA: hypothetical protein VGM39_20660 [Kofleriaceae bacterium]|jgi:hypothetical protein